MASQAPYGARRRPDPGPGPHPAAAPEAPLDARRDATSGARSGAAVPDDVHGPREGRSGGSFATVLLILLGLCLVAAAGVVSSLPPAYESEASVALQPRPGDQVPSAEMITLLATPYVTYATSDSTLTAVSETTDVPFEDLRSSVSVTMPAGSTNVEVLATFDDRETASTVAAEVARRIEAFASTDRTLVAEVVVPADEAEATTLDRLKPVLAPVLLGLGLLLVLAGATRSVLGARRRRARTSSR